MTENVENGPAETEKPSQVIGLMGTHDGQETAYMFLSERWGKGHATEASKAWMTWYWKACPGRSEERGYLKVVMVLDAVASWNVLGKCGLRDFTWWYGFQYGPEKFEEEGKREGNERKKCVMLDVWKVERQHSRRDHLDSSYLLTVFLKLIPR